MPSLARKRRGEPVAVRPAAAGRDMRGDDMSKTDMRFSRRAFVAGAARCDGGRRTGRVRARATEAEEPALSGEHVAGEDGLRSERGGVDSHDLQHVLQQLLHQGSRGRRGASSS